MTYESLEHLLIASDTRLTRIVIHMISVCLAQDGRLLSSQKDGIRFLSGCKRLSCNSLYACSRVKSHKKLLIDFSFVKKIPDSSFSNYT